jgi:hypothetical protein
VELDIRTKDHKHKVSIYGDVAENILTYLMKQSQISTTTKSSKDGTIYKALVVENFLGFKQKIGGEVVFELLLSPDDYVIVK